MRAFARPGHGAGHAGRQRALWASLPPCRAAKMPRDNGWKGASAISPFLRAGMVSSTHIVSCIPFLQPLTSLPDLCACDLASSSSSCWFERRKGLGRPVRVPSRCFLLTFRTLYQSSSTLSGGKDLAVSCNHFLNERARFELSFSPGLNPGSGLV